jgi:hypothetical protein
MMQNRINAIMIAKRRISIQVYSNPELFCGLWASVTPGLVGSDERPVGVTLTDEVATKTGSASDGGVCGRSTVVEKSEVDWLVDDDASGVVLVGLTEVVGVTEIGCLVIMPLEMSDESNSVSTPDVVIETATEDTVLVTVLVRASDTGGVVVVEITVGVGVTDTRVPEPSLEVPEEGDSVGKGETVVVSGTVLYTEVVTVLMKPCEGGSVGEGAVLVASGPVVYTDEDIALTIVVMKPGEGEPVGEGTRLVVSSPEEDTMVVTLAVEPDWKDSVGKEGTVVASSPVVYTDEDLVVAIVAVKPDEDDLVGVGALLLASGAVVSGGGDSVGEGASWVVSSAEEETMVVTLAGDSVDEGESLAVVTLAVELVDGSDFGEVMIKPTEGVAATETRVIATLVVPMV